MFAHVCVCECVCVCVCMCVCVCADEFQCFPHQTYENNMHIYGYDMHYALYVCVCRCNRPPFEARTRETKLGEITTTASQVEFLHNVVDTPNTRKKKNHAITVADKTHTSKPQACTQTSNKHKSEQCKTKPLMK